MRVFFFLFITATVTLPWKSFGADEYLNRDFSQFNSTLAECERILHGDLSGTYAFYVQRTKHEGFIELKKRGNNSYAISTVKMHIRGGSFGALDLEPTNQPLILVAGDHPIRATRVPVERHGLHVIFKLEDTKGDTIVENIALPAA